MTTTLGIPGSLRKALCERRVVPFVGAGISRAVRKADDSGPLFPSWKELLLKAADKLDGEGKKTRANLVRALLEDDPPNYLQSADRAENGLGKALCRVPARPRPS